MELKIKKILTEVEIFLRLRGFKLDKDQREYVERCLKGAYLEGRLDGLEWSMNNIKK